MFQNKIEVMAFIFSVAGAVSMIMMPVLTVASSYSFLTATCACGGARLVGDPVTILQPTVWAWTLGAITAIVAVALYTVLPRLRRAASSFLVFASLVYWSGFFNFEAVRFWILNDPAYFAWPPVLPVTGAFLTAWPPTLVVVGALLTWVSGVRSSLAKVFWLSFVGGFLMLLLALPPLVFPLGRLNTLSFPYSFLGLSTMVFGGILTMTASLVAALFPLSRRFAGTVSMWGFFYYVLGLGILLSRAGDWPSGFGLAGNQLFEFAAAGIVFSLPAVAAKLMVFRAEAEDSRGKDGEHLKSSGLGD